MGSPFEGMGAALAGVHGAPVTHRPAGGGEITRRWIVREFPEDDFSGSERPIASASAELRLPRGDLPGVATGDEIETEDGARFEIGPRIATPNPASDALIPFELRSLD